MEAILSKVAALSGAVTALSFAVAVLYELGFYTIIGSEFLWVVAPFDFFRTAVTWVPYSAILFAVTGALGYILRKRDEADLLPGENPSVLDRPTPLVVASMLMIASGGIFITLFFPPLPWQLYVAVAFIAIYTVTFIFVFNYLHYTIGIKKITIAFFSIGLFYCAYVFLSGGKDAVHLIQSRGDFISLIHVNGKIMQGHLLRAYDKGILFHGRGSGTITFWQWEEVKEISKKSSFVNEPSLRCRWWGVACDEPER